MSRIEKRFAQLRQTGRKALIPYITAGDPRPDATVGFMHALVAAGADVVELGIPFSDPMADGPVIQAACERALVHDTSLPDVLAMVSEFRRRDADTPVVLMGYLNPIEVMGYERFAREASEAGVDGVLTVDLPPGEAVEVAPVFREAGLDSIFLLSPTTTEARMRLIADHASGFVYYVSLKGVTGSSRLDIDAVEQRLALVRKTTDLPIGVGFGISDAAAAARVAGVADAVVVGSALVRRIEQYQDDPKAAAESLSDLVADMRRAMDDAG